MGAKMADRKIGEVVVLGAGVMGAQIAAFLAGAGLKVRLLDLPLEGDEVGLARKGLERAQQARPPAFYLPEMAELIELGSIEDLECIGNADWVIEAVLEESEPKRALLERLEPHLHDSLIISTNTSGLSITGLAAGRTKSFQQRFMGVHFFNPPRYMKLVEVIPGPETDPEIIDQMARFLSHDLGKGVVHGRDTPNFIGNRMWVFAAFDMLQRMEGDGLGVEEVDALTGLLMGRPKSATLRVCDLVGLDTVAHVAETSYDALLADPWRSLFRPPAFYTRMLEEHLLGAKVNSGFYRKSGSDIEVLDLDHFVYRAIQEVDLGDLQAALRDRSPQRRLQALWNDRGRWGEVGRNHLRAVLAYAAEHAAEMAGDIEQIDQAMRWGFNWDLGPFEIWDLLGVDEVVRELEEDHQHVPDLAVALLNTGANSFYTEADGVPSTFSSISMKSEPREYRSASADRLDPGRASWSNDGAYLVELEVGIGALVFSGRMNALGPAALEAVHHAVDTASLAGLVLCGAGDQFSVGADLKHMARLIVEADWEGVEAFVAAFQEGVQALRYAPFPVVAAVHGLALGGGCEFSLGADCRIAAAEVRMGLVETKVGLIPGSGGCMEMMRRNGGDIESAFATIFAGRFSDNAFQARSWRFLDAEDEICLGGENQLLNRAVAKVQSLNAGGYSVGESVGVPVAGDLGLELIGRSMNESLEAGQISEHDAVVGRGLARVLAGGGGAEREVEESYVLDLEREVFLHLSGTELTRARIEFMLKTGKPLRN